MSQRNYIYGHGQRNLRTTHIKTLLDILTPILLKCIQNRTKQHTAGFRIDVRTYIRTHDMVQKYLVTYILRIFYLYVLYQYIFTF